MLDQLRKELKKYGINLSESSLAMVLGALVVIVVGFAAYRYIQTRPTATGPAAQTENQQGELGTPGAAVALPTSHTVVAGETLWSIAEKYYASGYNWVDISAANSLSNPGAIEVNQKLTIPKVEAKTPTVAQAMTTTVTANKITGGEYTVIKGDDLWDIAVRAYGDGYKWTQIAQANNLANPDMIYSGNVLKLPR
ncbi:MAG: LysM peptidoglycan-binding domain-containing protein [Patescibacteria group bacterium]|nr:LysM peptidoglycan-binding domain-containing protein [Patescibacteria group bacterium]MCL5432322.1 LysM peptidoglycan-binding domain-containing protein [Patescibacteria group bacterium]